MPRSLNFEVAASIFDCLEVGDLFRTALASRRLCDMVSTYLLCQRLPSKLLKKDHHRDVAHAGGRLRLARSVYNRRIVYFHSPKGPDSLLETSPVNISVNFPSGTIIEDTKVLQTNFLVTTFPHNLFVWPLKAIQTREATVRLRVEDAFFSAPDVLKFDMCANSLFLLTTDKKVWVRHWGVGGPPVADRPVEFLPSLKLFKEPVYKILKIYMNDQYIVFITSNFSIYLVDATAISSQTDWETQSYNVFRVEASREVRSARVTSQNILLLEKHSSRIWDLKLDRTVLLELLSRYAQEERPDFLTLYASSGEMGGNQSTGVVANFQNLLMLEVKTRHPSLDSLGKMEVVELFHRIGLLDYDKVILHNNISGKDLMGLTEKSIQSIFGMREKSHSVVRLLDEIEVKKATVCHPPSLFLLGNNYNGLFGKDGNLNNYCEVPPPVFDINEEISSAEIASYNVVLTTNKHRSFISIKREALEDPKRRKSSLKNDQEDPDSPKNKKDTKNKTKKDKKGKPDKPRKKDYEKPTSRPPRNQTEWVCLEDLLEKHWGSHFRENDHVYRVQGTGGYFNTIITESPTERVRPFETAAAFLAFIKHNKVFEPDNILFCAESINKYYIYDEILASPQLLKDIRIIKRKSDHLALWSKYNPTFDVRRNLV